MTEQESLDDTLVGRYERVRTRLVDACRKAGRDPAEVELLAVSKTRPGEQIAILHAQHHRHFGENYVQEWMEKDAELAHLGAGDEGIQWHIIGPLQRNKCKYVAGKVSLIHTVHSLAVARELEKRTPEGVQQPVLLQINAAQEASKSGFTTIEEVIEIIEQPWQRLKIEGFMTIPPFHRDPEMSRDDFRTLRRWQETLASEHGVALAQLSMGMSHDLEVAVEEGATIVRVGTAIFGPRQ